MVFGGENAESYYDEGVTASMKGDVVQAIKHFERAIEFDRSFFAAYHQLGKCYLRLGKAKKAARLLHQVVSVKPKQIPARVDLGYAFLEMGKIAEARRLFSDVAAVKPENTRAQLGMAHCAFQEGNWNAAMMLAREAVDQGGANFAALYLLGRAATLAGRIDISAETLKRAEALIEKSIETSPDQPEGYFLRGEVHFAQEDFAKALDDYRSAEERARPDKHYAAYGEHFGHVDIFAKRGLCLERIGNVEAAREIGEKILKIDPNHKIGKTLRKGLETAEGRQ